MVESDLEVRRFLVAAGFRHYAADDANTSTSSSSAVLDADAGFRESLERWLREKSAANTVGPTVGPTSAASTTAPAAPPVLAPNDILTRALFPLADDVKAAVGDALRFASLLGMRIGEMHKLLSRTHIDAFAPEALDAAARREIADAVRRDLDAVLAAQAARGDGDELAEIRSKMPSIERRLVNVAQAPEGGVRIRIHGDLQLKNIRFTGTDFLISNFGSSSFGRPKKQSPLVDVASILRSFHHVAAAPSLAPGEEDVWRGLWYRAVSASFLGGWLRAVAESTVLPSDPAVTRALIDLFLLAQCTIELQSAGTASAAAVALQGIKDVLETERKPGQMKTSKSFTPFVSNLDAVAVEPSGLDPESPPFVAFKAGKATHAHHLLGARVRPDGRTELAVWAPAAMQVAVIGDFNEWSTDAGLLTAVGGDTGVFAGIVRNAKPGQRYMFRIANFDAGEPCERVDPFARATDPTGVGAGIITASTRFAWTDREWMSSRAGAAARPMSIYEIEPEVGTFSYRENAAELAERVTKLGFTHVSFRLLLEHRDDVFGPSAFFTPNHRFGTVDDLKALVDTLHRANIGVIFSWSAAHFALNPQGLESFDGSPTFESSSEPMRRMHSGWGTGQFDFGRPEVRSFLLSSATFWIEELHADGLCIEELAIVLFRDHQRAPGTWSPNVEGGRENLEGHAFVRQLTSTVKLLFPDVILIADASAPKDLGGFDLRRDTGFVADVELALSGDGAGANDPDENLLAILTKADADASRTVIAIEEDLKSRGAALRLLYTFVWAQRGKKLMFALSPHEPEDAAQIPETQVLAALNKMYRDTSSSQDGDLQWLETNSPSVLAFVRGDQIVMCNFSNREVTVANATSAINEGAVREGREGAATTLAPYAAIFLARA